MASEFEELLQLVSKAETTDAKLDQALSLFMLATGHTLASEDLDLTPGDPEWKAIAARAEARGLRLLANEAASVEKLTRTAAELAATPGGEAVAETLRGLAVSAEARGARAGEFAALMRSAGALDLLYSAERPGSRRRCRRPNARYFGPEWSN